MVKESIIDSANLGAFPHNMNFTNPVRETSNLFPTQLLFLCQRWGSTSILDEDHHRQIPAEKRLMPSLCLLPGRHKRDNPLLEGNLNYTRANVNWLSSITLRKRRFKRLIASNSCCRSWSRCLLLFWVFLTGSFLIEEGNSEAIRKKREDLERFVSKIKIIEDHQSLTLLKNCFDLPKLQYFLHIVIFPVYWYLEDLKRFDNALGAALVVVTNVRFGENSLAQVELPDNQDA